MFNCDIASFDLTPLPILANGMHTPPLSDKKAIIKTYSASLEWLSQINDDISRSLERGTSIRQLVTARACAIDSLLVALFTMFEMDKTDLALFATGGYGRGELSLYSDIDILLLSPNDISTDASNKIDKFVTTLWDLGLEPALAVRSISEAMEAALDHTIASAQLESRLLIGNEALQDIPVQIVNEQWSPRDFFDAKTQEAKARHIQHNSTEYNLEPNIKTAPGGLRDIHLIGWVTKRYFRVSKLYDLVQQDFLTEKEFDELSFAEGYLWQIRHHLHVLTGRNENKLLFDYQREVAQLMGYATQPDDEPNAAVRTFYA